MTDRTRAVQLARRPNGLPTHEDFAFVDSDRPELAPGEALVENIYLSVDPYMRGLMNSAWELHAPLEGRGVGRVIESNTPELEVGDLVFHWKGWRTHTVLTPAEARLLPEVEGVPLSAFLGVLGGTGLTAYVGLTQTAHLQPGETVLISAAAGGVGSAAGQIARVLGAGRVLGSVGSDAKVSHVVEQLGFDAAVNYRNGPLADSLSTIAGDGVDVYFDNVGGTHLEAAISVMRDHGRIALCGAISQYNGAPSAAPSNLFDIGAKALRMEGLRVRDHLHRQSELEDLLIPHIVSGAVRIDQTLRESFDEIVDAFIGIFSGANTGKTIVRVRAE
jgi:NADPH-dependent curcumin reductase CurA